MKYKLRLIRTIWRIIQSADLRESELRRLNSLVGVQKLEVELTTLLKRVGNKGFAEVFCDRIGW